MTDYDECVSVIRSVKSAGASTWTRLTGGNPSRVAIGIFAITAQGLYLANDSHVVVANAPGVNPVSYPIWFYRCRHGSVVTTDWWCASADATAYGVIEVISTPGLTPEQRAAYAARLQREIG
jgi:hypothetical protein